MKSVNLRSFKIQSKKKQRACRYFLTRLENSAPRGLDSIAAAIDKEVWKEIDCLSCANCCKEMTPTFTPQDLKRIATHVNVPVNEFKEKWLKYEKKDKYWVNASQPCHFLDLKTNKCSIYALRPADCAGFPHLTKKKALSYLHVHKQNMAYCPAALKFIELLKERIIL
jgi:Fe-S-cluster containining protein